MSNDLKGYIRQSVAAKKYEVSNAAITLRRKRTPNKVRTKIYDGAVFVFEDDIKNFAPDKTGPKPAGKRKKLKVS